MKNLYVNVSRETRMVNLPKQFIAVDGENLQSKLIFTFIDEFVDGQARLEYEIKGNKNYVVLDKENENYTIPVKNVITKEGQIDMQLVITEGINEEEIPVFKSNKFYLYCNSSINAVEEAPDGYELWIEQANVLLSQMQNIDIDIQDSIVTITKKDGTVKSENVKGEDYIITEEDLEEIENRVEEKIQENLVGEKYYIGNKVKGEIFNDYENNIALETHSTSFGSEAISGQMAYYMLAINTTDNAIALSMNTNKPSTKIPMGEDVNINSYKDVNVTLPLKVGDRISIINNAYYYFCADIDRIENNIVYCSYIPFGLIDWNTSFDDHVLFVSGKPTIGVVSIVDNNFSAGLKTISSGKGSFACGRETIAAGGGSFAGGRRTKAGYIGTATGLDCSATGNFSFATNNYTSATGESSSAFGTSTKATGASSFACGGVTEANGERAFASGAYSKAIGAVSTATGANTIGTGAYSFAANNYTNAIGESSATFGSATRAEKIGSFACGGSTTAKGDYSFVTGYGNVTEGYASTASGYNTKAKGMYSFATNLNTSATGANSFATGNYTLAEGNSSSAFGTSTRATGKNSFACGGSTEANGETSFATGFSTHSNNLATFTTGRGTTADAPMAFAANDATTASAESSSAFGQNSTASGIGAFATGQYSISNGIASFTSGIATIANGNGMNAGGKYNATTNDKIVVYGNGKDTSNRSDAYWLDWNGNGYYSGELIIKGNQKVATEEKVAELEAKIQALEAIINN